MYNVIEKREYKRAEKPYTVEFRIRSDGTQQTGSNDWFSVDLMNLSAGGAFFFCHKKDLENGTLLDLKVDVSEYTLNINCIGKVTRIERPHHTSMIGVAINFIDIEEHNEEAINTAVEEFLAYEFIKASKKRYKIFNRTSLLIGISTLITVLTIAAQAESKPSENTRGFSGGGQLQPGLERNIEKRNFSGGGQLPPGLERIFEKTHTVVPVNWIDTVGVTVNGNSITKNASYGWGNGGASSLESFTGDGGVEFVATQKDTYRMCGLSSTNTDANYTSIKYAIYLYNSAGLVQVRERGFSQGDFGSYQIGDRFSIERVGSIIVYKKNDVIFHTSKTPTDSPLFVDCAIHTYGGEISDVNLIRITGIGGGQSDTTPPSAPDNLQATAVSASQIDLSWDSSIDPSAGSGQATGVTGYRIYRDGIQIATTRNTTYQDIGLCASTTYIYNVSAIDGAGNESFQSLSVSATTGF